MVKNNQQGALVISLDFEMMWGNIESWTTDGYGATNVAHVREVVSRLIALFEEYGVKATFATVGLIMQKDNHVADIRATEGPSYDRSECSPYEHGYLENIQQKDFPLYFAPDIVEQLKASPNVEIGTHTYCHYYCWEKGQTASQFEADIKKAVEVAKANGITLSSIVYPRNQVTDEYLRISKRYGIKAYRGNAVKFFEEPKNRWQNLRQRACRLLDSYLNVGGYNSYPWPSPSPTLPQGEGAQPVNIPASRFVRPYNKHLAFLDCLRLRRIRKEMEHAAKTGEVYHLWWHPHNMGAHIDESFAFLRRVLDVYRDCHERYGMQSMTMGEISRQP